MMSGDHIGTTTLAVNVQENGIIRAKSNGYLIGRLTRDVCYEDVRKLSTDHVIYGLDEMEHILNCFDNLFYIDSFPSEDRAETVEVIRKACQDARKKWNDVVRRKLECSGVETEPLPRDNEQSHKAEENQSSKP